MDMIGVIGECRDRSKLAGVDGDRERSRRLREDIMFLEGTAVIEEGMKGASCFAEVKGGSFALPVSERGHYRKLRRR